MALQKEGQSLKRKRTTCKTGCRTCKIRKVKCDEGRPACKRCISTGRVCDGYGIWGGGGNSYAERQQTSKSGRVDKLASTQIVKIPAFEGIKLPFSISILTQNTDEAGYFEWFSQRAMKKLAGPWLIQFWDTLLFQASPVEPAVFHAILTLSSVHKGYCVDEQGSDSGRTKVMSDRHEQFMLQHYSKAIRHLQPHFSAKDKASIRVALIACVLFTCIEILRGNFKTSMTHLTNGLSILREAQGRSITDGVIVLAPARDATDQWIAEAFSRLHLQVELFRQTYQHPVLVFQPSVPADPIRKFQTISQAWTELERIFHSIFHLKEKARQHQVSSHMSPPPSEDADFLVHRYSNETCITHWSCTYSTSKRHLDILDPSGFIHHLLSEYHAMATIMISTALSPSESAFDAYTPLFLAILSHSIAMWKLRFDFNFTKLWPVHGTAKVDMSHSMIDMGWLPPLYYVALKCRVRRLRLHAVRLLKYTHHREGAWDSRITANVARKIVAIEEGIDAMTLEAIEGFWTGDEPELSEMGEPNVPSENRLSEVKVLLGDGPRNGVEVEYLKSGEKFYWQRVWVAI